jgi:hypothetical protein
MADPSLYRPQNLWDNVTRLRTDTLDQVIDLKNLGYRSIFKKIFESNFSGFTLKNSAAFFIKHLLCE